MRDVKDSLILQGNLENKIYPKERILRTFLDGAECGEFILETVVWMGLFTSFRLS